MSEDDSNMFSSLSESDEEASDDNTEYFTMEDARAARISNGTRGGYASGLKQIVKWISLVQRNDLLRPDGTIDLTRWKYDHFVAFLEWTVNNKDVVVGTLASYRSAIKNYYKDQGVPLPVEYNDDLKELFRGLTRRDATNRQSGERMETGMNE